MNVASRTAAMPATFLAPQESNRSDYYTVGGLVVEFREVVN